MTTEQALAWAEARAVDRWRMVRETSHPSETDMGTAYAQADADAMSTLADVARMVPAVDHEAEREAAFRAGYRAAEHDINAHTPVPVDVNAEVAALARWRETRQ